MFLNKPFTRILSLLLTGCLLGDAAAPAAAAVQFAFPPHFSPTRTMTPLFTRQALNPAVALGMLLPLSPETKWEQTRLIAEQSASDPAVTLSALTLLLIVPIVAMIRQNLTHEPVDNQKEPAPLQFTGMRLSESEMLALEEWLEREGAISWDGGPRYGTVKAQLRFNDLYSKVEVYPDPVWAAKFPEMRKLKRNIGGWVPEPGAFGQMVVSGYDSDSEAKVALIGSIDPGLGYRDLRKTQKAHLNPWKKKTAEKLAAWWHQRGRVVLALHPVGARTAFVIKSDIEVQANYTKPFQGGPWETQQVALHYAVDPTPAPNVMPWHVYQPLSRSEQNKAVLAEAIELAGLPAVEKFQEIANVTNPAGSDLVGLYLASAGDALSYFLSFDAHGGIFISQEPVEASKAELSNEDAAVYEKDKRENGWTWINLLSRLRKKGYGAAALLRHDLGKMGAQNIEIQKLSDDSFRIDFKWAYLGTGPLRPRFIIYRQADIRDMLSNPDKTKALSSWVRSAAGKSPQLLMLKRSEGLDREIESLRGWLDPQALIVMRNEPDAEQVKRKGLRLIEAISNVPWEESKAVGIYRSVQPEAYGFIPILTVSASLYPGLPAEVSIALALAGFVIAIFIGAKKYFALERPMGVPIGRMAPALKFYKSSPHLQSYRPVDLNATLNWLKENRAQLGDNSLSFLMHALILAGRLPKWVNSETWRYSAGAYDRAVHEKESISREIRRIWSDGSGEGKFRTPLSRLKALFNPDLMLHQGNGKPLSTIYRNLILSYAWNLYGKELVQEAAAPKRDFLDVLKDPEEWSATPPVELQTGAGVPFRLVPYRAGVLNIEVNGTYAGNFELRVNKETLRLAWVFVLEEHALSGVLDAALVWLSREVQNRKLNFQTATNNVRIFESIRRNFEPLEISNRTDGEGHQAGERLSPEAAAALLARTNRHWLDLKSPEKQIPQEPSVFQPEKVAPGDYPEVAKAAALLANKSRIADDYRGAIMFSVASRILTSDRAIEAVWVSRGDNKQIVGMHYLLQEQRLINLEGVETEEMVEAHIAVAPEVRRQGVARLLDQASYDYSREQGIRYRLVTIDVTNTNSFKLVQASAQGPMHYLGTLEPYGEGDYDWILIDLFPERGARAWLPKPLPGTRDEALAELARLRGQRHYRMLKEMEEGLLAQTKKAAPPADGGNSASKLWAVAAPMFISLYAIPWAIVTTVVLAAGMAFFGSKFKNRRIPRISAGLIAIALTAYFFLDLRQFAAAAGGVAAALALSGRFARMKDQQEEALPVLQLPHARRYWQQVWGPVGILSYLLGNGLTDLLINAVFGLSWGHVVIDTVFVLTAGTILRAMYKDLSKTADPVFENNILDGLPADQILGVSHPQDFYPFREGGLGSGLRIDLSPTPGRGRWWFVTRIKPYKKAAAGEVPTVFQDFAQFDANKQLMGAVRMYQGPRSVEALQKLDGRLMYLLQMSGRKVSSIRFIVPAGQASPFVPLKIGFNHYVLKDSGPVDGAPQYRWLTFITDAYSQDLPIQELYPARPRTPGSHLLKRAA